MRISDWSSDVCSSDLASADPFAPPHIDFNYGHDERDLLRLVAAIKRGREVFAQSAFDEHRLEELKPGAAVQSDAELLAWVRQNAETAYHPVGSCRMGSDAEAVVDPQLRVRGVQRLRVIAIGSASWRERWWQYV